ncbi:Ku family protein [Paenibacillus riograndensis]|uniref:Ku domain-containing protein n=1 Tax=Paenibacillus riograndensis SBR5 TaxID=1073571 RepID=A0A0E4CWA3_9BACL|nr:hypothetical protein [Paenibacillus riograndensis]CQR55051.1 hypothetical protein PRIO_2647 [Paenibacillus riograndensis SBR5]
MHTIWKGSISFELDKVQEEASKRISILDFLKEDQIDLMYTQKAYFLGPVIKPVNGNCIQLATLHYANEIRSISNVPSLTNDNNVNEIQLKLALQVIKGIAGKTDLTSLSNPGQEKLQAAIQSSWSTDHF